jgi:hypothetical protein
MVVVFAAFIQFPLERRGGLDEHQEAMGEEGVNWCVWINQDGPRYLVGGGMEWVGARSASKEVLGDRAGEGRDAEGEPNPVK